MVRFLFAVFMGCVVVAVDAHELGRSESKITVQGRDVRVLLRLDALELRGLKWAGGDMVAYGELDHQIDGIYASVKEHFRLDSPAHLIGTELERYQLEQGHVLRMDLLFHFEHNIGELDVTSTLDRMTRPEHRHVTSVSIGGAVQHATLDASAPRRQFTPSDTSYRRALWLVSAAAAGLAMYWTATRLQTRIVAAWSRDRRPR
jgi:hypothetical protein